MFLAIIRFALTLAASIGADFLPAIAGSAVGLLTALVVALCGGETAAMVSISCIVSMVLTLLMSALAYRVQLPGYYGCLISQQLRWKRPVDALGDALVAGVVTAIATLIFGAVQGFWGFVLALVVMVVLAVVLGFFVTEFIRDRFSQQLAEQTGDVPADSRAGK